MTSASKLVIGIILFGSSSLWSYSSIAKPGLIGALLLDAQGRYRKGQGWFFLTAVPLVAAICAVGIPITTIAPSTTGLLHVVRLLCDVVVVALAGLLVVGLVKNPLFPLPRWLIAQQQLVRRSTDDPATVAVGGDGSLERRAYELVSTRGTVTEREAADALSLSLPKTRRLLGKLVTRSALGELPAGIGITLQHGKGEPATYVFTRRLKES